MWKPDLTLVLRVPVWAWHKGRKRNSDKEENRVWHAVLNRIGPDQWYQHYLVLDTGLGPVSLPKLLYNLVS